ADRAVGVQQTEHMRVGAPINPQKPVERLRHSPSSPGTRPSREPHPPCTGARSATSHWMSLTVHLVGAQVFGRRFMRRRPAALPTRWPSSGSIVAKDSRRLWKRPEPWTHSTRPPLLGKRSERVSHSSHKTSSSPLSRKDKNAGN